MGVKEIRDILCLRMILWMMQIVYQVLHIGIMILHQLHNCQESEEASENHTMDFLYQEKRSFFRELEKNLIRICRSLSSNTSQTSDKSTLTEGNEEPEHRAVGSEADVSLHTSNTHHPNMVADEKLLKPKVDEHSQAISKESLKEDDLEEDYLVVENENAESFFLDTDHTIAKAAPISHDTDGSCDSIHPPQDLADVESLRCGKEAYTSGSDKEEQSQTTNTINCKDNAENLTTDNDTVKPQDELHCGAMGQTTSNTSSEQLHDKISFPIGTNGDDAYDEATELPEPPREMGKSESGEIPKKQALWQRSEGENDCNDHATLKEDLLKKSSNTSAEEMVTTDESLHSSTTFTENAGSDDRPDPKDYTDEHVQHLTTPSELHGTGASVKDSTFKESLNNTEEKDLEKPLPQSCRDINMPQIKISGTEDPEHNKSTGEESNSEEVSLLSMSRSSSKDSIHLTVDEGEHDSCIPLSKNTKLSENSTMQNFSGTSSKANDPMNESTALAHRDKASVVQETEALCQLTEDKAHMQEHTAFEEGGSATDRFSPTDGQRDISCSNRWDIPNAVTLREAEVLQTPAIDNVDKIEDCMQLEEKDVKLSPNSVKTAMKSSGPPNEKTSTQQTEESETTGTFEHVKLLQKRGGHTEVDDASKHSFKLVDPKGDNSPKAEKESETTGTFEHVKLLQKRGGHTEVDDASKHSFKLVDPKAEKSSDCGPTDGHFSNHEPRTSHHKQLTMEQDCEEGDLIEHTLMTNKNGI